MFDDLSLSLFLSLSRFFSLFLFFLSLSLSLCACACACACAFVRALSAIAAAGNYRCSLAGVDLNRQWDAPDPQQHPEIRSCKQLLCNLLRQQQHSGTAASWPGPGRVHLFMDLHGHSVANGHFTFGCQESGPSGRNPTGARVLPTLLSEIDTSFDLSGCRCATELGLSYIYLDRVACNPAFAR